MVSAKTRRRVMKAVELLGYVPNATAKNLRTLKSGKLLVTVPDLSNPFFALILQGNCPPSRLARERKSLCAPALRLGNVRSKSQGFVRLAALSSGLRQDLEKWLKHSPDSGPDGWLFPSEKMTTPLAKDNAMYRYIRPQLKAIGFDWVDFDVMRRTHSSLMRDLGVDPKIVADQQGHTLDVNLNVYTETSVKSRLEAVETLESAFVN